MHHSYIYIRFSYSTCIFIERLDKGDTTMSIEPMDHMIKSLWDKKPSNQSPIMPPVGQLWKDTDSTVRVWTGKEWIIYTEFPE